VLADCPSGSAARPDELFRFGVPELPGRLLEEQPRELHRFDVDGAVRT
jgi:hypothetical protein